MEQLTHTEVSNPQKTFPIAVIADELRTPQNVGMCLRVCEAFGIDTFYQNEQSPNIDNRLVQRTARNAEKRVAIKTYKNLLHQLQRLKEEGYLLLALEITDKSKDLSRFVFSNDTKIALVIGSERFGITPEALDICKESVHIQMFGQNSSMNVVNSLSVCLYEITKQLN